MMGKINEVEQKEIIIHIGSGKTGSTSIQRSLFKHRNVNDNLIKYPCILGRKDNQIFRFGFCKIENTPSNIRAEYKDNNEGYMDYQESIKKSFKDQTINSEVIVVSSEFLFLSQREEIKNIKSYLESLGFNSFKVVVYIREPSAYYLSAVQQALKTSPSIPSPSSFHYDFKKEINLWNDTFGDIVVRPFKKDFLVNQDVVQDFSSILNNYGYPVSLGSGTRVNESLSAESSQAMQDLYNKISLDNFSLNERKELREVIANFIRLYSKHGSKPILKDDIRQYIRNRFNESTLWINEKYQFNFKTEDTTHTCPNTVKFRDIVVDFNEKVYCELKEYLFNEAITLIKGIHNK